VVEVMNTISRIRKPNRAAEGSPTDVAPATPSALRWPVGPCASSVKPRGQGLPRCRIAAPGTPLRLWWLGVHGGAGETTLAQLLEGSWEAGHAWPQSDPEETDLPDVILVARTNARGLRAAQLAAIEWASGSVAVRLRGLVLIADAPGRLPPPLKDFARVVAGGVPRVWRLPWVESWRLGHSVCAETAPRAIATFLDELRALPFGVDAPTPTV
jgi:uncharacterized protein DUF6668